MAHGIGPQLLDGPLANKARRNVDDAQQADLIIGIHDHAQIRQHVLDLAPLVKPYRADQLVTDTARHQGVLQGSGLGIGAEHDGTVPQVAEALSHEPQHLLHHVLCFLALVIRLKEPQQFAWRVLRPQSLVVAQHVASNHVPRSLEDGACGAIVLF